MCDFEVQVYRTAAPNMLRQGLAKHDLARMT